MKNEWRKLEKSFYLPGEQPELLEIPAWRFWAIDGTGNPNAPDFAERIGVLYSLSYAVRMMPKSGYRPEGYGDYTVYPLEGLYSLPTDTPPGAKLDKDRLIYTLMIRQPDFITEEVAERALSLVRQKKPHPLLPEVRLETVEDGLSVQLLHIGPFDDEPRSFERMHRFIDERGLSLRSLEHREIYLNDFRKTEPSRLKTVLRYRVNPA
ncbi:GyrI-like domain-containing protein [Gorillibacterium sp. sgz500922]|uniref:GyrI-like domain-containing protein n=1 Tax=Gorillibacterium sp. sgz500922 TaxID=3446694 RepID=UPI003F67B24D